MNASEKRMARRARDKTKPLTEQQITAMNEIFPGFGPWYRAHYIWNQRLAQAEQAETTEQREVSA